MSTATTAIRGNSLYTIVDGPSWTQAEANSVALGGHLITINDHGENEWVTAYLSQNQYSTYYSETSERYALETREDFWIGLGWSDDGDNWKWSDNSNSQFRNWQPGEPNSPSITPFAELIVGSDTRVPGWGNHSGQWNDEITPWHMPIGGTDADRFQFGIAEIPLQLSIDLPTAPTEGAGPFTTSINLSAGTQESGNLAEGATVYWQVSGITEDDLDTGALTGSGEITSGKLDIQHSLKKDGIIEREDFEVSVYSDADFQYQIGNAAAVAILDRTTDYRQATSSAKEVEIWTNASGEGAGINEPFKQASRGFFSFFGRRPPQPPPQPEPILPYDEETQGVIFTGSNNGQKIKGSGTFSTPERKALKVSLIVDAGTGADEITGGLAQNWIQGGGVSSNQQVDALTGVSDVVDVFDLRSDDYTTDTYALGSAKINNYGQEDYIALSGNSEDYVIERLGGVSPNPVSEPKRRVRRPAPPEPVSFNIKNSTSGDLLANVRGGFMTTSTTANDLNILYGVTTSPIDTLIGGEQLFA